MPVSSDQQAATIIEAIRAKSSEAHKNVERDYDAIMSFYSDEAVLAMPHKKTAVFGKEAIRAELESYASFGDAVFMEFNAKNTGSGSLVTHTADFQWTSVGSGHKLKGDLMLTYGEQPDGDWKIIFDRFRINQ